MRVPKLWDRNIINRLNSIKMAHNLDEDLVSARQALQPRLFVPVVLRLQLCRCASLRCCRRIRCSQMWRGEQLVGLGGCEVEEGVLTFWVYHTKKVKLAMRFEWLRFTDLYEFLISIGQFDRFNRCCCLRPRLEQLLDGNFGGVEATNRLSELNFVLVVSSWKYVSIHGMLGCWFNSLLCCICFKFMWMTVRSASLIKGLSQNEIDLNLNAHYAYFHWPWKVGHIWVSDIPAQISHGILWRLEFGRWIRHWRFCLIQSSPVFLSWIFHYWILLSHYLISPVLHQFYVPSKKNLY